MKFVLAIVALLAVATAVSAERTEEQYRAAFTQFMQDYNKTYPGQAEFSHRYSVFKTNLDFIDGFSHPHFTVGVNEFADMSNAEFVGIMNGFRVNNNRVRDEIEFPQDANPSSVDWRTKGVVTKVKNQGQCGSCWSFSTTGSTEGAHALKTGKLVSLSEQNLMDCSWKYGNLGCNGGQMDAAFRYIIANKGVDTEVSYPYTAHDGTCRFSSKNVGATLSSFKDIPRGNEASLESASATVGPISVAIDASHMSFQFYKSGVYYEPRCSATSLDHGVLVVGYGVDSSTSQKYWIVKNSWGATWGQAGYIWMSKDRSNNCGIATEASYPIV